MTEFTNSDQYQNFLPSRLATEFWNFYKVIWEAERRFDLIFRRDHNVAVWTANRVRYYYLIAEKLGLYDAPKAFNSEPLKVTLEDKFTPVGPVDHIIQTGANGPATELRKRERGCVYTSDIVNKLLDSGSRLLLIHGAPDELTPHPSMQSISFDDFNRRVRQKLLQRKQKSLKLDQEALDYWKGVASYFEVELGIQFLDPEDIRKRIQSHRRNYFANRDFLDPLQAKSLICMAHYFRSPLIEAAKDLKLWTVDYQHGINSRYHLGYGYPNVKPEHRNIPYMPDEFWSWGKIWTDPDWFPTACCTPRQLGHHQETRKTSKPLPFSDRPEKTILIATSWALKTDFKKVATALADGNPDWVIRLKLHPMENLSEYNDILVNRDNLEVVSGDIDVREAASRVRYVLSICSSSLFDVLLEDCRIAVLKATAVEYAEDFILKFDVPVLEPDVKNFDQVVAALRVQQIPCKEVFHNALEKEWELLTDSLSTPLNSLRLKKLENRKNIKSIFERKALRYFDRVFDVEKDAELLLLPYKGGPLKRYASKVFRRNKTLSYYSVVRDKLVDLDSLDKQVIALETAIGCGLEPVRIGGVVREVVQNAFLKQNAGSLRRVTETVFSDAEADCDIVQAEFFEHYVASRSGDKRAQVATPHSNWVQAISILRDLSPMTAHLADSYEKFSSAAGKVYADTRVSKPEQEQLASDLSARINAGDNFTMMRLGDGEVYAFEASWVPVEVQQADQALREKIWWGQTIEADLRRDLQERTQQGLISAEYLGIPSAYRLLRDIPRLLLRTRGPIETWHKTARAHRVLFAELDRLVTQKKLDWSQKTLLDDRCHQGLFLPEHLDSFVSKDRPAVLVNCFSIEQVNSVLGKNFFARGLRLPPHTKVKHLVPDDTLANSVTPLMLDEILDQVDQLAKDGAIFFVAGGFVGKAVISHISELNATALDIGAAADYWMGAATRGPLDFADYGKSDST